MGATGVGKSALLNRLVRNIFCDGEDSVSIGASAATSAEEELYRMEIYCGEHCALHLELQDTASTLISHGMRRLAIATAHVFVLVYSVNDHNSFDDVLQLCEEIIKQRGSDDAPILLVGNKTDIHTDCRITISEAKQRASVWGVRVVEISAKYGTNASDILHEILRLCDASCDLFLQARRRGGWRHNIVYVVSCCFPRFLQH
ncbi:ras-related protein Rap-2a-like [Amphiura filiformis]|uniref:ras-related protein Rap-2a-like n=1 Tax=Amphiura filiformis TaxID=82378 RepID=UPI003B20E670